MVIRNVTIHTRKSFLFELQISGTTKSWQKRPGGAIGFKFKNKKKKSTKKRKVKVKTKYTI